MSDSLPTNDVITQPNGEKAPDDVLAVSPKSHFTRIEHRLLMQLPKLRLSDRQHGVLLAVLAKTLRWHKAMDWITASQIAELMDYRSDLTHIRNDIKNLVGRHILTRQGKKLGLNLILCEWVLSKAKPQCEPKLACLQTDRKLLADRPHLDPKDSQNGLKTDENQSLHNTDLYSKEGVKEKARAKGRTYAPAQFQILPEHLAFAKRENIGVDLIRETEKFLDYHRAKGSKFSCWTAAWRNWIRNSQTFSKNVSYSKQTSLHQKNIIQNWLDGTLAENPLTGENKDFENGTLG